MNQRNKEFGACVIPSVLAFALSGICTIADGLFVGNSVGGIGLSTINMAYPVTGLIQGLETGIGMGGAISYSIYSASGEQAKASDSLYHIFIDDTI